MKALQIGILVLVWGSTWLVIKIGLEDMPPFLSAGVRFLLGAAILFVLARAKRIRTPRSARLHLALLALGLTTFSLSYGAVYWSEQYLPSGLTAVLFATHPFFTLVLAHPVLPAERFSVRKLIGIVIGFTGVAMIFRTDLGATDPNAGVAAAVLLLSPLAAALSGVSIKRWGSGIHPYTLTTLPMTYGAIVLLAISIVTEDVGATTWSATAVASIVYLAVFGSVVGFVVYYSLLRQVPVTTLNMISYLFPIVAVVLGYVVLDEVLDRLAVAGAAAIVTGIAIATYGRRRAALWRADSDGANPER